MNRHVCCCTRQMQHPYAHHRHAVLHIDSCSAQRFAGAAPVPLTQAWLRQLRGDLLSWQVHCPGAISLAVEGKVVCLETQGTCWVFQAAQDQLSRQGSAGGTQMLACGLHAAKNRSESVVSARRSPSLLLEKSLKMPSTERGFEADSGCAIWAVVKHWLALRSNFDP